VSAPSGEQFEISHGEHRATIVEVGGGIRRYEVEGRPVLDPFPVDAICDGAHGMPLIPWPNRLDRGRYSFDGEQFQLPLTEPEQDNAIHGFFLWRPWIRTGHEQERVELCARLHPMPGYPFQLDLSIVYSLDDAGLTVTTTAVNTGERACPYGHGQHPYLSPGNGTIDECALRIPGRTRITTGDRQLPDGREAVAGTEFDFREPTVLGDTAIDFAFTDLDRDENGLAWTSLGAPDGSHAEIWVDRTFPIVEIYTGDTLAPERARRGLGTEPMTCAPDGFNNGEGLLRIEPGESVTTTWGARLR
jgi:aldose 1-epimerase